MLASERGLSAAAAAEVCVEDLLREARARERAGDVYNAVEGYTRVIQVSIARDSLEHAAEAYLSLGVMQHRRNQPLLARSYCQASEQIAAQLGDRKLVAQALEARAAMDLEDAALQVR